MPHSSASGSPIAWKNSSTSTGVGAAPTLIASTWSRPSIARRPAKISASACATSLGELGRDLLAALLEAHLADRGLQRRLHLGALLGRLAGHHRLQARLQLLPDARHGEEPAGAHFGQVGEHLARVVAAGDLQPEDDRQVVVGVALGDVGGGQPRDHPAVARELDQLVEPLDRRQQVAVDQLTPFGGPVVPEV